MVGTGGRDVQRRLGKGNGCSSAWHQVGMTGDQSESESVLIVSISSNETLR